MWTTDRGPGLGRTSSPVVEEQSRSLAGMAVFCVTVISKGLLAIGSAWGLLGKRRKRGHGGTR